MKERRAPYDAGQFLTWAIIIFIFILLVFVCTIIGIQIWKSDEANTESWAALTGIIGWATGIAGMIYSNRFGTTMQSTAKDATIAQQANTAAVVAGAATPTVPAKVETLNVSADTANVTEKL